MCQMNATSNSRMTGTEHNLKPAKSTSSSAHHSVKLTKAGIKALGV